MARSLVGTWSRRIGGLQQLVGVDRERIGEAGNAREREVVDFGLDASVTRQRDAAQPRGLSDHVWSIEDLVALMPVPERAARGTRNGRREAEIAG